MSAEIRAHLDYVNQQLDAAEQRRAEVESALTDNRDQLDQIQLDNIACTALNTILEQIETLEQRDSLSLLWGDSVSDSEAAEHKQRIEATLADHGHLFDDAQQDVAKLQNELAVLEQEISTLRKLQQSLQDSISRAPSTAEVPLADAEPTPTEAEVPTTEAEVQLTEARESQSEVDALPPDTEVRPAPGPIVLAPIVLPWSNRPNDTLRLRLIMLAALIVSVLLGLIVPRWELPEPERVETIEIPKRLATLIVKKAPPPPPPVQEQPTQEETPEPAETAESETAPEEPKTDTRESIEKVGLLAFSQDFDDIINASDNIKMGSQATITEQAPAQRSKPAPRALITSEVDFSASASGTSVNRTDVIGDRNTLKKVEFTRIDDTRIAAIDRKQAGTRGAISRRSDEDIQLVFDRYKDALYRIYNRELRKNSFLKGKLVLQITIEADGKVSKCLIASSDLNSDELEKKIVARVLRFNFGKKQDVSPLTILYPIEFFPAS